MGKHFTAFVHVDNGAGKSQVFRPGDPMPAWAEEHVSNPKVWSDDDSSEPPRSGPGSGKQAWADYARDRGLKVTDDMSRDDIVAAVDAGPEE